MVRSGGAGILVGFMTGFFGVGGGFLIVPALTVLLGLAMRRAIATSLAIIAVTGAAALTSHLAEGAQPDWPLTLVLCAAAAAGALSGSGLSRRLPVATLARTFAVVVAAVAMFLLVDVLVLGGPPAGEGLSPLLGDFGVVGHRVAMPLVRPRDLDVERARRGFEIGWFGVSQPGREITAGDLLRRPPQVVEGRLPSPCPPVRP